MFLDTDCTALIFFVKGKLNDMECSLYLYFILDGFNEVGYFLNIPQTNNTANANHTIKSGVIIIQTTFISSSP